MGISRRSWLAGWGLAAARGFAQSRPSVNRMPLVPGAFIPLPLTSVKPQGWLLTQLRIQADGLGGHLDEVWADVGPNSGWLGGTGESWERGPYFLDGLVPLAYLLEEPRLIAKVRRFMDWVLEHQHPDGNVGPIKNTDWWPIFVLMKALTQYQEATGDARVIPFMQRYYAYQLAGLPRKPLESWGRYRWHDGVLSVFWLYNRTGDRRLIELAELMRRQGHDWHAQFANFRYKDKVAKPELTLDTHVVNNAMALKASAIAYALDEGDALNRNAVYHQFRELDRYHLLPNGLHSGDEHYAGHNPTQGTELCAVVEAMFSLEVLLAMFGDAQFGDRLEKIAYNALPGTFDAAMWAHQYDQQANQVLCSIQPRPWTNNEPDSNIYGLEPNFGCCTSNFHQGWPKFTASLWMAARDQGLAAMAYAPCEVKAQAGGVPVRILEETEYPFRERVRLSVHPASPAAFPLLLRVPAWAEGARISVNGQAADGVWPGEFFRLERLWKDGDSVELVFPMQVRASRWYHDSVALERGPLVLSLRIGEDWRKIKERAQEADDWEVRPTTPWNYGLKIDPAKPAAKVLEKPLGERPFSPQGAPLEVQVPGRRIAGWEMVEGSAGPLPSSPVKSDAPDETVTLIPYGSAKLRITAFPVIE